MKKTIKHFKNSVAGFTLVELIVSVAIIGGMMAFSVVKFQTFNKGGQIKIVAQKIVSDIRKVQSYALGLKEYDDERPGGGWGIYFSADSIEGQNQNQEYVIYPDYGDGTAVGPFNHLYDPAGINREDVELFKIPDGIWVSDITIQHIPGGTLGYATVNITVEPPEPKIYICDRAMIGVDPCDDEYTGEITRITLTNGVKDKIIEVNRFGLVDLIE